MHQVDLSSKSVLHGDNGSVEGVVMDCLALFNNKINIGHMTRQIYHNNTSGIDDLHMKFKSKKTVSMLSLD
jgi:hypothetical protein